MHLKKYGMYLRMIPLDGVYNSVGLIMEQGSVYEWDRHKMEVNKQEQRSYIKIAVLSHVTMI